VSPFTSAQCLAIAERKMGEAKSAPRHGKELEATAQAWLVLAKRVAEAEFLEKQAAALETANVAPDIAITAASSNCSSLQQIANDIRGFHLSHPASYA
jgi:hypothetical protein